MRLRADERIGIDMFCLLAIVGSMHTLRVSTACFLYRLRWHKTAGSTLADVDILCQEIAPKPFLLQSH